MSDLLFKAPMVYEPLRKNRFIVSFPADTGLQSWWVSSSGLPSINQSATELPFLNTSTWVLGRYVWEDLEVTFRSFIGPSTTQAIMEWVRLESESVTGRQGYAVGYKRNITISMLDPTGVQVQKWVLINAFPTTVNFGDLAYDGDDVSTITCNFKYDYAINVY
jgi:hypothetical protein